MTIADLIRARIARGSMPETLDLLLERRGTLFDAARDLSNFANADYDACLEALNEIYYH